MLQNPCKTLGFKTNMVYKIPPGGEVNHIQPVAYIILMLNCFKLVKCHHQNDRNRNTRTFYIELCMKSVELGLNLAFLKEN